MRPNMMSTQLGGTASLALLAPVRPGFVEGFESVTFSRRLELLLKTLNAIRQASREAALLASPFPDSVARFGILRSFRYALVPPDPPPAADPKAAPGLPDPGRYRLSLNVTFDGGWETYMRVIYRDLGTLLDAIFCNCEGYLAAHSNSYDAYTRWVRAHEVGAGLFYTESSLTALDQRYLEGIERIHREEANPALADAQSTAFALKQPLDVPQSLAAFFSADKATQAATLRLNLRALKALYDLRPLFPPNHDQDDQFLLRFARRALREFVELLGALLASADPAKAALLPFGEQIDWISKPTTAHVTTPRVLAFAKADVQAGIVTRYDGITHGALVLLRVTDAAAARQCLAALPVRVAGDEAVAGVHCNVAFTLQGLRALGVPPWRIDMLPQEFIEGMETRAGLLGDVRTNHPNLWRRPRLNVRPNTELDLASVHVVVQYRIADRATAAYTLHPALSAEAACFNPSSGFALLAIEAMRSWPDAQNNTREHFGFTDGISQPLTDGPPAAPTFWKDRVERGEVLLGYPNQRGDGPYPPQEDRLLDNGSFLVLRKIRQRVDVLDALLKRHYPNSDAASAQARIAIRERMMGRRQNGQPLVTGNNNAGSGNLNDFDYARDSNGAQCPFHSHARRTNPRAGEHIPRIVRRGMSYGPRDEAELATERGVYFMAHCASIAEQFEVIQRWVAGGNSSGVGSAQSDPYLGVPPPGERRVYRFLDDAGQVLRVELGDQPLTELQWGLYLFVPAIAALKSLDRIVAEPEPPRDLPARGKSEDFKAWQRVIEDPVERDKAWRRVAASPNGTLPSDYGRLVANTAEVTAVLKNHDGQHSVCGYGARLAETLGIGYLGMDDPRHAQEAESPRSAGVNQAIADISLAEAFGAAVTVTTGVLQQLVKLIGQTSGGRSETSVDIVTLSDQVLAKLCTHWFGLPDGKLMVVGDRTPLHDGPPRCPGHFLSVARYVFWPHPSDTVQADARAHGKAILEAVKAFLQAAPSDPAQREQTLRKLSYQIEQRLQPLVVQYPDIVARSIAGTMLGFPPTVQGNFVRVLRAWLQNGALPNLPEPVTSLWNLQAELAAAGATPPDLAKVSQVLREPLIRQMRQAPVPEVVWRQTSGAAGATTTVLGLTGVMQNDPKADPRLMFGGVRSQAGTDPLETTHACPGYDMAIGVLLGMLGTLMQFGSVRASASPTIFTLVTEAVTPGP